MRTAIAVSFLFWLASLGGCYYLGYRAGYKEEVRQETVMLEEELTKQHKQIKSLCRSLQDISREMDLRVEYDYMGCYKK